jgi:PTS system fructose-specific IIC component
MTLLTSTATPTTGPTADDRRPAGSAPGRAPTGAAVRGWLMTGVSYVIPFVAAGGLLLALGIALGGPEVAAAPPVTDAFDPATAAGWGALLHQLGALAFGFLVPVLGGAVAYAIADRPALVPGFVGGGAGGRGRGAGEECHAHLPVVVVGVGPVTRRAPRGPGRAAGGCASR